MKKSNTIQVVLFKGSSLIDRIIKLISWSKYSHAGVKLPDGTYYESLPGKGVQILSYIPNYSDKDIFTIKVSDKQLKAIKFFLNQQKGKAYDWKGVARFIFRQPVEQEDRARWFCSELVFSAFLAADIKLLNDEEYKVSPEVLSESPLLTLQKSA